MYRRIETLLTPPLTWSAGALGVLGLLLGFTFSGVLAALVLSQTPPWFRDLSSGSKADWLAAVGTVLAFGGVIWQAKRIDQHRRDDDARRQHEARREEGRQIRYAVHMVMQAQWHVEMVLAQGLHGRHALRQLDEARELMWLVLSNRPPLRCIFWLVNGHTHLVRTVAHFHAPGAHRRSARRSAAGAPSLLQQHLQQTDQNLREVVHQLGLIAKEYPT